MSLKSFLDKRFIRLVAEPILRRIGTGLAVYLASQGVPDDLLQQFIAAIGVLLGIALEIGFASNEKRKAENAGMRKAVEALNAIPPTDVELYDKQLREFGWR
ncbi:hypothetical protein [Flyfo microvirus Tbat2_83]|nr:hypothetical protein [Flyfo microvirus Tbat2_83]